MRAAPLILFFTYRVSLATWAARGILEREVALYHRMLPHLHRVGFVTYGPDDGALASRVAPIEVLPRPRGLSDAAASLLMPLVFRKRLSAARVLKTNQVAGAWTGLIARRVTGRPLIVRSGYLWSANRARESGSAPWRRLIARLERLTVRAADRVMVTNAAIGEHLVRTHAVDPARVRVVPNAVDTDAFRANPAIGREKGRVVFVGRLSPEKNLVALVEAVAAVRGARCLIVGEGEERERVVAAARRTGADVELAGVVPNAAVPALLDRAEVFVLPSKYEGQPKVVLEAMAAGLPVLGADVPGLRELVRHGETGWLVPGDRDGLAGGIRELLSDAALRARLGDAGRQVVAARHSLDAVTAAELAVIDELAR